MNKDVKDDIFDASEMSADEIAKVLKEDMEGVASPTDNISGSDGPDTEDFAEDTDNDFSEEDFELAGVPYDGPGDGGNTDASGKEGDSEMSSREKKKFGIIGTIGLGFLLAIILFAVWVIGTDSGRNFGIGLAAKFMYGRISNNGIDEKAPDIIIPDDEPGGTVEISENGDLIIKDDHGNIIEKTKEPRSEDYVTTYLIFGLEEINGAANSDAMMLVSINTLDNTLKITSLLRDTYVDIPGWDRNKLNSVYAKGARGATTAYEAKNNGAALLIRVIENTYDIKISGYACVNFESFEKIIDRLGGLDIELGKEEAAYLRKNNYISKEENRTVVEGMNHLNGNQVMGYVRVRKEVTLGGGSNDFGRTVRQRRVIKAIIDKYKSAGIIEMVSIMKDCMEYVYTSLTEKQITDALTTIINNKIFTTESMRLPAGENFKDSGKKGINNGKKNVTYALVIDDFLEINTKLLHEFVFLDGKNLKDAANTEDKAN